MGGLQLPRLAASVTFSHHELLTRRSASAIDGRSTAVSIGHQTAFFFIFDSLKGIERITVLGFWYITATDLVLLLLLLLQQKPLHVVAFCPLFVSHSWLFLFNDWPAASLLVSNFFEQSVKVKDLQNP